MKEMGNYLVSLFVSVTFLGCSSISHSIWMAACWNVSKHQLLFFLSKRKHEISGLLLLLVLSVLLCFFFIFFSFVGAFFAVTELRRIGRETIQWSAVRTAVCEFFNTKRWERAGRRENGSEIVRKSAIIVFFFLVFFSFHWPTARAFCSATFTRFPLDLAKYFCPLSVVFSRMIQLSMKMEAVGYRIFR